MEKENGFSELEQAERAEFHPPSPLMLKTGLKGGLKGGLNSFIKVSKDYQKLRKIRRNEEKGT
jgi:hypothetical protein